MADMFKRLLENERFMKWMALVFLTLQNVSVVLLSRYVRSRPGDMFISSTAVLMSEAVKLVTCLLLIYIFEDGCNFRRFLVNVHTNLCTDWYDNLLIGVPGIVYAVQNNLIFIAVSHLNASVFQVSYQLKLFTTAVFFRVLLHRILTTRHWIALSILFAGVALAQLDGTMAENENITTDQPKQNPWFGMLCVLTGCVLSGFAGVFFELVLKSTEKTIVTRNIQLAVYGILASLVQVFLQDKQLVYEKGFLVGYDYLVWIVIFIQSLGGLLVAAVVRYADNILKNFATSVAIVLTLILSVALFGTQLTFLLFVGNIFVISSTVFYNLQPPPALKRPDLPVLPT